MESYYECGYLTTDSTDVEFEKQKFQESDFIVPSKPQLAIPITDLAVGNLIRKSSCVTNGAEIKYYENQMWACYELP